MLFARFVVSADTTPRTGIARDGRWYVMEGDPYGGEWSVTGESFAEQQIRFLAPLIPGEIIGIGANYAKEEAERIPAPDLPIFFLKPRSTVIGTDEEIVLPMNDSAVKFEAELAVVIGKEAKEIGEEQAPEHIFGYTVANDVTAPKYFHPNGHWTVGKSFDTFCPLGPVINTEFDPDGAIVEAYVNGELKQRGPVRFMITSIPRMIAYLSSIRTLRPGDVILTGSPAGADFVGEGDVVTCKVDGIGILQNRIAKAGRRGDAHD